MLCGLPMCVKKPLEAGSHVELGVLANTALKYLLFCL